MEFTGANLLDPLVALLGSKDDVDAHYFALAGIGLLHRKLQDPRALAYLEQRQEEERDPERVEWIKAVLAYRPREF